MSEKKINAHSPIGVFDSGVGGLSILKSLSKRLPNDHFVYLGDTARLPYGTKGFENIRKFTLDACRYLDKKNVKSIVIACHTASSYMVDELREIFPHILIEGVAEASADYASSITKKDTVLVFCTEGTSNSQYYERAIAERNPNLSVLTQPCGLLVTLAEEGWVKGEVPEKIVKHYLEKAREQRPEAIFKSLILGCTHFSILADTIKKVLPEGIQVIEPGDLVADWLVKKLTNKDLFLSEKDQTEKDLFLVTDHPERFKKVANHFLDQPVDSSSISLISLKR